MKKNITLLAVLLFTTPLFAETNIRENGGFVIPAAAKIEFYSPGNGIDRELKTKVDAVIQEYKDAGLVAVYKEEIVGMEGETNICVLLTDVWQSQKLNVALVELLKTGLNKTNIKFASSCEEVKVDDAFRPKSK